METKFYLTVKLTKENSRHVFKNIAQVNYGSIRD